MCLLGSLFVRIDITSHGLPKAGITEEQAVVVWRLIGNVLNLIAPYNTNIAAACYSRTRTFDQ